jgi:hypothetical protein
MSYNRSSSRRSTVSTPTPYCKVCHDAGKSKAIYTSHFVKDSPGPNGKVICPYLLSLNCRYCKENGHTLSHCEKLKYKNARLVPGPTSTPPPVLQEKHNIPPPAPTKPNRGFAVLANLAPESDPNADHVEVYPTPSGVRRKLSLKPMGAWAMGAPQDKPAVAQPRTPKPSLPSLSNIDDSWLENNSEDEDDWNTHIEMGEIIGKEQKVEACEP